MWQRSTCLIGVFTFVELNLFARYSYFSKDQNLHGDSCNILDNARFLASKGMEIPNKKLTVRFMYSRVIFFIKHLCTYLNNCSVSGSGLELA